MLSLSILPRLCRSCGRSSNETAFPTLSKHRCTQCSDAEKGAREQRITARGPRLTVVEQQDPGHNPKHLVWIRRLPCAVRNRECIGSVHAHHVRENNGAGTGMKPADAWAIPVCAQHHTEGHASGWKSFSTKYQIDLRRLALQLAALSPHTK